MEAGNAIGISHYVAVVLVLVNLLCLAGLSRAFSSGRDTVVNDCQHGLVYVYGLNDTVLQENCYKNNSHTWDTFHSESQHSMNKYIWSATQYYRCFTKDASKASFFFVTTEWRSCRTCLCYSRMVQTVQASPYWTSRKKDHQVFLWDTAHPEFAVGKSIQLADDQLYPLQQKGYIQADGTPCRTQPCYEIYNSWGNYGMTEPYFYFDPSPIQAARPLDLVGAWSNQRGSARVRNFRRKLSSILLRTNKAAWIDTTVDLQRNWNASQVQAAAKKAWLCVIPPGDSPSRRALFTCIVAGAIPVICSDKYVVVWPQLKWDGFSFRIPEAECATMMIKLTRTPVSVLSKMQKHLFKVRHLFNIDPSGANLHQIFDAYLDAFTYVKSLTESLAGSNGELSMK